MWPWWVNFNICWAHWQLDFTPFAESCDTITIRRLSISRAVMSGETKQDNKKPKIWTDWGLATHGRTVPQWGLQRSHTAWPSGFTMSRTFETPSFTVGIFGTVGLALELLCTRDGQSVCVHNCGMWKYFINMWPTWQHENKVLHFLWYAVAYTDCCSVIVRPISLKKIIFCFSTLVQLPNYRNSFGMRLTFRFVLLFMEEGERKEGEKMSNFTSGHFPIFWPSVMM